MQGFAKKERCVAEELSLEDVGLQVAQGEVDVGQVYPILGVITRFVSESTGGLVVELNNNIMAHINSVSAENRELLKSKAFETGIFVALVLRKDPVIEVECQAVIFGKNQAYHA